MQGFVFLNKEMVDMFKKINNDNGIALMMVLVLLILVGGLTAALMSAGVFNIRFGGDEVEKTQAFYAADAGIEYIKNTINNNNFENIYEKENGDYKLSTDLFTTSHNSGKLNFEIGINNNNVNEENKTITFESIGKYNGVTQKILIDYAQSGSDAPFQIEHDGEKDDALRGQAKHLDEDYVYVSPDLEPPSEFWYEEEFGIEYFSDEFRQYRSYYDENYYDDEGLNEHGYEDDFEKDYETYYNGKSSGNNEFFTAFINGGTTLGSPGGGNKEEGEWEKEIVDTILVVDGDLTITPQVKIKNSIIVTKGELTFTGSPTDNVIDSMFYVYSALDIEDDENSELFLRGLPKGWKFDNPPDLEPFDISKHLGSFNSKNNWRQVR